MLENIKIFVSRVLDILGILNLLNSFILRKRNTIRVINYHRTPINEIKTFENQLKYYKNHYVNVNYEFFKEFKNGKVTLPKQGLIITFDDGLLDNYIYALPLLEKYGFTGYFLVSTGKIGKEKYMDYNQLKDLINRNHVVGCHTYTHHRMNENDKKEILDFEIVQSKEEIEKNINKPVDIFCWCGGEEDTYTINAQKYIEKNYKYSFMTNSELLNVDTNNYFIQRTNIEARWPISLVKFQLSGIMDYLYKGKRERVNRLLRSETN